MNQVSVTGVIEAPRDHRAGTMVGRVRNGDTGVALMVRLKLVNLISGRLVAPVMYSDNYFSLPPGESKQVTIRSLATRSPENEVALCVEGWNVTPAELARVRIGSRKA